ncbi:hypothetical protein M0R72_16215 [Candidatus Pacearchaeota archaeon]|nr:hypothetical protein [Candidatus Pacearchaeota archaeon]
MANSESIIEVKVILEETEAVRQLGKLLRDMAELIDSLPEWGCESKQIAARINRRANKLLSVVKVHSTGHLVMTPQTDNAVMAWLKCRVSPGQFTNECAIRVTDSQGGRLSTFVPMKDVVFPRVSASDSIVSSDGGLVKVEILDRSNGLALIKLPNSALETDQQTVTVVSSEIVELGNEDS